MMTQDEFLERVWREVIRSGNDGKWIDSIAKSPRKKKSRGEQRIEVLLRGMKDKGVSTQEIVELLELDRCDSVFTLIQMIEQDGIDEEAWEGIHEAFETAAPGTGDEPEARGVKSRRAAAGAPILTLKRSHHVAFSPDSARVVAAEGGKIWEIAGGKEVARCELPPHASSVAWSPKGEVIAMQSTTGAIRLCDAKTGKKVKQVKMSGEGSMMDFSPDGKLLAAGDWNGNLFAWDAATGKLLSKRELGEMICFVHASQEEVAVIAGEDAIGFDPALKCELWRAKVGRVDHYCLHLTGKERLLIGWDGDRLVKLELGKRKKAAGVKLGVEKDEYPKMTTVSPDGRHVCTVHGNEFILLNESLRELGRQRIEYANSATFSSDSRLIALASLEKGEIWRVGAFPKEPTEVGIG